MWTKLRKKSNREVGAPPLKYLIFVTTVYFHLLINVEWLPIFMKPLYFLQFNSFQIILRSKTQKAENEDDKNEDDPKWRRLENRRWLKMKTTQNEHDQNWSWQKWRRPKPSKIYCIVILCWKQTNRPTDRLSEIVRLMAGALHSIVLNQLPENLIEILIKNQFIFHIRKSLERISL